MAFSTLSLCASYSAFFFELPSRTFSGTLSMYPGASIWWSQSSSRTDNSTDQRRRVEGGRERIVSPWADRGDGGKGEGQQSTCRSGKRKTRGPKKHTATNSPSWRVRRSGARSCRPAEEQAPHTKTRARGGRRQRDTDRGHQGGHSKSRSSRVELASVVRSLRSQLDSTGEKNTWG